MLGVLIGNYFMNTKNNYTEYHRISGSLDFEFHNIMIEEAFVFRSSLLQCGYLPVPLYSGSKAPCENNWIVKATARAGLTQWSETVSAGNWNSGILCTGLFGIDVDVDDPVAADAITNALIDILGMSPAKRVRGQTCSRYLALYRAGGKPEKRKVGKVNGYKVDILSDGQQCMAHGVHPSCEMVEWITNEGRTRDGIARVPSEDLPLIQPCQITEFLARCESIFHIEEKDLPTPEPWTRISREQCNYTDEDVADLVANLPADTGYDDWVAVLSAIYRSTDGTGLGKNLAHEFSRKSGAYSMSSVEEKWRIFRSGGALKHDFGYLLNRVREGNNCYLTPSFRAKRFSHDSGFASPVVGVPADQVIMEADF